MPRRAPQVGHSTWIPGVSRSCDGVRAIAPEKGHCDFLVDVVAGGASPTRSRAGARSPTRPRLGGSCTGPVACSGGEMGGEDTASWGALGCRASPLIPSKLHKCSRLLSV